MAALESIFADLSSPDNDVRRAADSKLENAFAQDPDTCLCELVHSVRDAPDRQVRLQALPLFRRLAFRRAQGSQVVPDPSLVAWDGLKKATQEYIKSVFLQMIPLCVTERNEQERNALVSALSQIELTEEERGHTWRGLVSFLSSTAQDETPFALRDIAYKVHAECPVILQDMDSADSIEILMRGMRDAESSGVQLSALKATSAYLLSTPTTDLSSNSQKLLLTVMQVASTISESGSEPRLADTLKILNELFVSRNSVKLLFPIINDFTTFLMSLITNQVYGTDIKQLSIELLASIAEHGGSEVTGYSSIWTRVTELLLSLMSTVPHDPDWQYNESVETTDAEDHISTVAEQTLDRIALCQPSVVLPTAFSHIPTLIQSQSWQERNAGLSALGTLAEACTEDVTPQLGNILQVVRPAFHDDDMRVQYAAIYAISQLATFFDGELQRNYAPACLHDLTGALSSKLPRIQAYAASALVNFFEEIDAEELSPYISDLLTSLLRVLETSKLFVQMKVLSALSSLAAASAHYFAECYGRIMPLLLQVLENDTSQDEQTRQLQGRAIECAGRVAAAVDHATVSPDAVRLMEGIFRIRASVTDDNDEVFHHCMQAWACLARAMGEEMFQPYFSRVTEELLRVGGLHLQSWLWEGPEEDLNDASEGNILFSHNGQVYKVDVDAVQTKSLALESLVVIVAMGGKYYAPYIERTLEISLPVLDMDFADQLRDSVSALLVSTVQSALDASSNPNDINRLLNSAIAPKVLQSLASESYSQYVAKLANCLVSLLQILPGVLNDENYNSLLKAVDAQLYQIDHRIRAYDEGDGETTEQERKFAEDLDSAALMSLNGLIRSAYKATPERYPENVLVPWFEMFLSRENDSQKLWALRLLIDTVESMGKNCPQSIASRAPGLVSGLRGTTATVRQTSAYGLGICAQFGEHAFDEVVLSGLKPLLVACNSETNGDDLEILAKDNAVAAVAKIIKFMGDKVDVESLLPDFLSGLPILLDEDEIPVVYEILLGLIERRHPLVTQENPAIAEKVLCWLKVPIESNSAIPGPLSDSIGNAINLYTPQT